MVTTSTKIYAGWTKDYSGFQTTVTEMYNYTECERREIYSLYKFTQTGE